ncbi:hypothetical protein [Acinetobacter sp. ANC 4648]|uniref:hypothetical protein n=1 Tax=Acinetobacter sp. ANC 4648 TaxID=1977875 RepID=UPI000A35B8A0|nr:hypothetical protein [Acinetobacter sp. ANC 4648]OTG83140.1 hypothetical protein B9T27_06380 [Acinetobacter sp. ANC 4648]
MDDKKIYKLLRHWFPELKKKKLPKKKHRRNFKAFLKWVAVEKVAHQTREYWMKIDRNLYSENGLVSCSVLHDHHADIQAAQTLIRQRAKPLFEHFDQYHAVIGRYYSVYDQVFDIVFEEVLNLVKACGFEMLLIYADHFYWCMVPNNEVLIEKFCKFFEKQFKEDGLSIEHYAVLDCPRST